MKAEWTNSDSLTTSQTTKAILVIEIPNEHLWITLNDIFERMKGYKCSFKQMPQFMDEAVPYQVSETEVNCYQDPYATGFNDAIRLITGETE